MSENGILSFSTSSYYNIWRIIWPNSNYNFNYSCHYRSMACTCRISRSRISSAYQWPLVTSSVYCYRIRDEQTGNTKLSKVFSNFTTFVITRFDIFLLQVAQDGVTSPSPSFNNSNPNNIGFAISPPQNIGFNLPVSSATTTFSTSNGFNGTGPGFNNFPAQNNGNAAATSPLSDLDEFDVITNRGKLGASPQTVNNGT